MDDAWPERSKARHRRMWSVSHALLWGRSQRPVPCSTASRFIRGDTDLRRDRLNWPWSAEDAIPISEPARGARVLLGG